MAKVDHSQPIPASPVCVCVCERKGIPECIRSPSKNNSVIETLFLDAWLAQSVEHVTLDLGIINSSSTLQVEIT